MWASEPERMQAVVAHASPPTPLALTRTGRRAVRVGAFAFDTWSRLVARDAGTPETRAKELTWICENLCALHGIRPLVHGRVPAGPCILVANHVSYFDPLVLSSLVPLTAIAKREVSTWPVIGEIGRRLGVLYVERENPTSGARVLREAIAALEHGVSVLVFPEGTTSRGHAVLPFKRGIFGVAARLDVPVVPVALAYDVADAAWVDDETFFPHYMRSIKRPCTRVRARFLEPLWPSPHASAVAFAEAARRAIAQVLPTLFGAQPRPLGQKAPHLVPA